VQKPPPLSTLPPLLEAVQRLCLLQAGYLPQSFVHSARLPLPLQARARSRV
jgi:hypothetical protein